jgi:cytosine deaminase
VSALVISNVLVPDGIRQDVLIEAGVITKITGSLAVPAAAEVIDGSGKVLLPGFVDAHSHLDKSLLGRPWYPRAPRSLSQLLADERVLRTSEDWDYTTQILGNAEVLIANGATHTRAFVDVDTDVGLTGLESMLAVRERCGHALTMQVIAFAQSGVSGRPGTEQLLDEALAAGADIVGGMDPCSFERDPVQHLDLIFALAERHAAGVDVHLHEPGPLGAYSASLIIERAKTLQLPGPVVISHPDFLGSIPEHQAAELVEADVAVTTCVPAGDPKPPLRTMVQSGLVIGVGCDGQRDSWGPFNRSDMLFKAYLLAWRYGLGSDRDMQLALDLVSTRGAQVMGLSEHLVREGAPADLVMLPGVVAVEPLVDLPIDRTVIKAGCVVASGGKLTGSL